MAHYGRLSLALVYSNANLVDLFAKTRTVVSLAWIEPPLKNNDNNKKKIKKNYESSYATQNREANQVKMNTVALLAFAVWALFLRYLPHILRFLQLQRFSKTLPGPSVGELIANVKKGGK